MEILKGKPYLWKSDVYGNIAVHVETFSPNGKVAVITIDGGEAATPAQRFPELSDGRYFTVLSDLHKRPSTRAPRKAPAGKNILPTAEQVRNLSSKEAVELTASLNKPARKPRGRAGVIRQQAAQGKDEVTF